MGLSYEVSSAQCSATYCVQVYVAYTEGVNFKKALAGLLGLEDDASIGACLQRIRQFLDRQVMLFAHAHK